MPHTQQKPADPELSKGTCGKHKIGTELEVHAFIGNVKQH